MRKIRSLGFFAHSKGSAKSSACFFAVKNCLLFAMTRPILSDDRHAAQALNSARAGACPYVAMDECFTASAAKAAPRGGQRTSRSRASGTQHIREQVWIAIGFNFRRFVILPHDRLTAAGYVEHCLSTVAKELAGRSSILCARQGRPPRCEERH